MARVPKILEGLFKNTKVGYAERISEALINAGYIRFMPIMLTSISAIF